MRIQFIVAVAVLLGPLLFFIQQLRSWPGPAAWGRPPVWKKRIRVAVAATLLLIGSVAFWSFFIEPNRLVIHPETIQVNNWPKELSGLRIAVISDIHAGGPFIDDEKLRLIVARTNQLQPDLIVILVDYMSGNTWHGHRVEPEVIGAALKGFRAPLGVYSVLGNHDWWYDGIKVRIGLEPNGIKVLENEVAEVKWRGGSFWLVGLADRWTRVQQVDETIGLVPEGKAVIALTHNPDIFPNLPQRVQLLLAGHTHGGQVYLPIIGRPIEPSDFGQRYAAGHIVEKGHHLFVTTGIGTSILPVRFRVPPELVVLTLTSQ